MSSILLEAPVFNVQAAMEAAQQGIDRLELCANFPEGGETPSAGMLRFLKTELDLPIFVMIRPRGGDFVYTEAEFQHMKKAIESFKKIKVDGFVFGILKEDGSVNTEQNSALVALAQPYSCTFHRAFDVVKNRDESLEAIIACGFTTILTSGQQKDVVEGIAVLSELVQKANSRIVVMPGGGLRSTNIALLKEKTGAHFYHSSAIIDQSETANGTEIRALKMNLV